MIPYSILASASPRRRELLAQAGFSFGILPAQNDEQTTQTLPKEVVKELSCKKAEEIAKRLNGGEQDLLAPVSPSSPFLIIGADTIVTFAEAILGKPKDEEDAFGILSLLQGHTHQVYTGVTILVCERKEASVTVSKTVTFAEKTDVTVCPMTEEEIRAYIRTKDCMDKAGAYGIQGPFAIHIKGICGDYYNVVGLPISRLYQEVKRLGF